MLRAILSILAAVEVLAPRPLIDTAERIAARNPGAGELKPWVPTAARIEGAVLLALMWRSRRSYAAFKKFLGLVCVIVLWRPRAYVDLGTSLAYEPGAAPEWNQWVYRATRLVGLLYVLVALNERRED